MSQRAIEQLNRVKAEDWIRADRTETACRYLSASTAATWVIEAALRSRVERAVELYGASEDFAPQRKVREFCPEAIPLVALNGPEYRVTPALVRELRELDAFSKWERTMLERSVQIDQNVADPAGRRHPLEYLRTIRQAFVDFCASNSHFLGSAAHLHERFREADELYRMTSVVVGPNAEEGPYAHMLSKVLFRSSELAVTASEIVSALNDSGRLEDGGTNSGIVIGGTLIGLGGGTAVGFLSSLILGPWGALVGIVAGVGSLVGTGAGIDYSTVTIPRRQMVTDRIFKSKGVLDLVAHASFDSVRSVSSSKPDQWGKLPRSIEVSASGAYFDETRLGAERFQALYVAFSSSLMNAPREDAFGRFSRETYGRTVEAAARPLNDLRQQACDLYPLEWDGQKFCRLLHRRRCEEVGRDSRPGRS